MKDSGLGIALIAAAGVGAYLLLKPKEENGETPPPVPPGTVTPKYDFINILIGG